MSQQAFSQFGQQGTPPRPPQQFGAQQGSASTMNQQSGMNQQGMPQQPGMNQQGIPQQQGMPRPGMPPQPGMNQQGMSMPGMNGTQQHNQAPGGQGNPRRIDPAHMPRPTRKVESDPYYTRGFLDNNKRLVPRATDTFVAIDDGNANPRYMRMTSVQYPSTSNLSALTHIPLGCVMQPFAPVEPGEEPVPVIDIGEGGPTRCSRCRGYINLFCVMNHSAGVWKCNLCKHDNPLTGAYQGNYNSVYGASAQPELSKGSVEFVVDGVYVTRPAQQPIVLFVVDASTPSIKSGVTAELLKGVIDVIQGHINGSSRLLGGEHARVGLITYSEAVYFYDISSSGYKVFVASDVEDGFSPLPDHRLCLNVDAHGEELLEVCKSILQDHSKDTSEGTAAASGTALAAALNGLKKCGGRIVMLMGEGASLGQGIMNSQKGEVPTAYGTDNESTMYTVNSDMSSGFFGIIGKGCCLAQVSVDLFAFGTCFKDLVQWSIPSNITGGNVNCFSDLLSVSVVESFRDCLRHQLCRYSALEAVLKVRGSVGVRVVEYYGNGLKRVKGGELDMAILDQDNSCAVMLEHDGTNLDNEKEVYIQCAVLYTTPQGQRRVRVHNSVCAVTVLPQEVFRGSDIDAVTNILTRQCIDRLEKGENIQNVHSELTSVSVRILSAYRKHCAKNPTGQQLILPESLKLLPLYSLCALKSPALRKNIESLKSHRSPAQDVLVRTDSRVENFNLLSRMSVRRFINYIYPCMFAIAPNEDLLNVASKENIAPSMVSVQEGSKNVYLLLNGTEAFLYITSTSDPSIYQSLSSREGENMHVVSPPGNSSILAAVNSILKQEGMYPTNSLRSLKIAVQKTLAENELLLKLVEDSQFQLKNMPAYDDFLCQVHGSIQNILRQ